MKHVKTFENFHENFDTELNEGIVSWAKDIFGKVTEKFNAWKDKKAKEAAAKLALVIEQKSNDSKVKAKIAEIKEAFAKLDDKEKKQFMDFATEKNSIELAKQLDKAGAKTFFNGNILVKENVEEINEGAKEILAKSLKFAGMSIALVDIIYMVIVFCTLVGSGYVAPWALGAGLSAGSFGAIGAAVLVVSGIIAHKGETLEK
jgi:hypothetical protein